MPGRSAPAGRPRGRAFLTLLVLAALHASAPAAAGPADREPHGTFEAHSNGLPAGTVQGAWIVGDRAATLQLGGVDSGAGTTFVARWDSGVLPGDARPSGSGTLAGLQPSAGPVVLRQGLRYKVGSGEWSDWAVSKTSMKKQVNLRLSTEAFVLLGRDPARIRFQWRLVGVVPEAAGLAGRFEIEA